MKFFAKALVTLSILFVTGTLYAQTDVLYITDGDSNDIWAVQGGVVFDQNLDVGGNRRYRVAARDTLWLGDMDTGTNVELTQDLDPTGNTSPTGIDIFEGTDGAADGTYNYTVESFVNSAGVYRFGSDWTGGEFMFTVTGNGIVGITFDPVNGSLWISDQANVYEYDLTGQLLGQFAHTGSWGSLAYEPTTDTLWYVSNSSDLLRQYAKDGTLLDTVSSGVTQNVWGAEFVSNIDFVPGNARFNVTKTFTDGSTDSVDVTLTCNGGLPLVQDFTIAGGDPAGVTFVVTDLPDAGATCTVTESGGPDGYTPVLNGGAGCSWDGVTSGLRTCVIANEADPATFTVNKVWEVNVESGEEVLRVADITITCDAEIEGGYQDLQMPTLVPPGYDDWMLDGTIIGDGSVEATVDTSMGPATCSAEETSEQSGVEVTDDCGERQIAAGATSECTITNTVFFEGIPTLNQYGLAIMALLMLGMGMVGFRRFV